MSLKKTLRQYFILVVSFCVAFPLWSEPQAIDQENEQEGEKNSPSDIYNPEVQRREIDEALIDDEDFEIGFFYGQLNIEDFGASSLKGLRLTYHVNEDFFININGGRAVAGLASAEQLFGVRLITDEQRKYNYYDFNIGLNILPGEAFLGDSIAMNSSFYGVIGVGNTDFAGSKEFTYVLGAGYKVLYNDWFAFNLDTRDHLFNSELLGEKKLTHNFEVSLGFSIYF